MSVYSSQEFYERVRELGYEVPEQTAKIRVFLCPEYAPTVIMWDFKGLKRVVEGTKVCTNGEWLTLLSIENKGVIKEVEIISEMYGFVEANIKQYLIK